jgi:endonuclease/exonuclease/phosphatase family metal-dependent hydrolase
VTPGTGTIRLGSFNLLSGRSLDDGTIHEQHLVEAAGTLDVDVLACQEVDRHQPRSGGIDQTAVVAQALDAVDSRFVATVNGTPGERGWTSGGTETSTSAQYGVSLISRVRVAQWHVLRLSPARGRFPLLVPGPDGRPRLLWLKDEPRVAVAAVLAEPRLTVACTHLSFVPLVNVRQLRQVRQWLSALPGPQVLMGDLNLPPAVVRRVIPWTPLVSLPTFPSPSPRVQLDHVLAGDLPPGSSARGRTVRLGISDHRAVLVDVRLPDEPAV